MPRPTEDEIQRYLNLLRPASLPPGEQHICPLCKEIFEPYRADSNTDYAATPWLGREDSTCKHIVGRRCIESHLRSGASDSSRCPVCRQNWVGPMWHRPEDSEPNVSDGEGSNHELAERRRRRFAERRRAHDFRVYIGHDEADEHTNGITQDQGNARNAVLGPPHPDHIASTIDRSVSSTARINRMIALLERMLGAYDLYDISEGSMIRVQDIEHDVNELWEALDRHVQRQRGGSR
jgi:hypothetical protein